MFVLNEDNIHDANKCPYDMIIENDIIGAVDTNIKLSNKTIRLGDLNIPTKTDGVYRDWKALNKVYMTTTG